MISNYAFLRFEGFWTIISSGGLSVPFSLFFFLGLPKHTFVSWLYPVSPLGSVHFIFFLSAIHSKISNVLYSSLLIISSAFSSLLLKHSREFFSWVFIFLISRICSVLSYNFSLFADILFCSYIIFLIFFTSFSMLSFSSLRIFKTFVLKSLFSNSDACVPSEMLFATLFFFFFQWAMCSGFFLCL